MLAACVRCLRTAILIMGAVKLMHGYTGKQKVGNSGRSRPLQQACEVHEEEGDKAWNCIVATSS
eukprot:3035225-Rhodomonas_salina.1